MLLWALLLWYLWQGNVHNVQEVVQGVTLAQPERHALNEVHRAQGNVHKKKEVVQDVTLHDLDAANARPQVGQPLGA